MCRNEYLERNYISKPHIKNINITYIILSKYSILETLRYLHYWKAFLVHLQYHRHYECPPLV